MLKIKNLLAGLLMITGIAVAKADECTEFLDRAVRKFKVDSLSQFNEDFVRVLKMTSEERREAKKSGGISIKAIIEALPIGLDGSFSSDRLDQLSLMVEENESLVVRMIDEQHLSLEELAPEAIQAWLECVGRRGVRLRYIGGKDPGSDFILLLDYVPTNDNSKNLRIARVEISPTSATPVSAGTLVDGAKLKRFSSLSRMYKRVGCKPVTLNVVFDSDQTALSIEIPAIPPIREIRKFSMNHSGHVEEFGAQIIAGDGEMDSGDSWAIAYFSQIVEIDESGKGLIVKFQLDVRETKKNSSPSDPKYKDSHFRITKTVSYPNLIQNGRITRVETPNTSIVKVIPGKNHNFVGLGSEGSITSLNVRHDRGGRSDHLHTAFVVDFNLRFEVEASSLVSPCGLGDVLTLSGDSE